MKRFIFTFSFLLVVSAVYACSCKGPRGFYKSQRAAEVVVLGKVIRYLQFEQKVELGKLEVLEPKAMEVEILQNLKGKEERSIILINGGDGASCEPTLGGHYIVGEQYLFGLFDDGLGSKKTKDSEYYISSCGDYTLEVDKVNNTATGFVKRKYETVPLDRVLNKIARRRN